MVKKCDYIENYYLCPDVRRNAFRLFESPLPLCEYALHDNEKVLCEVDVKKIKENPLL